MDTCIKNEKCANVAEIDARCRSNTKRLDKLEQETSAIHDLAKNVAVMAETLRNQSDTLTEVKSDVQQLKAIPGKRWEQVVEKVFFALAGTALGALVTYAITHMIS